MNIEQLLEELRRVLQGAWFYKSEIDLLHCCYVVLSRQADLLRRAEMSVENCDMYREREASVPSLEAAYAMGAKGGQAVGAALAALEAGGDSAGPSTWEDVVADERAPQPEVTKGVSHEQ